MGLFGTLGTLFGKKKGKIVQEYFSPEIQRALGNYGKRLGEYAEQDREDASRARGQWLGDMSRYNQFIDQDISRMGQYQPGGLQERRYDQGIDRYRDAQISALQDAYSRAGARANQQQALLGGGSASPFMTAMLGNQMAAGGRQVAADTEGRRLGNMERFQGIGLGLLGRRGDMLKNKSDYAMRGFGISSARDRNTLGRTQGLIDAYDKGSWLRKKPDKLNWFGKVAAIGETLSQAHPFASPQQQQAGGNLANTPSTSTWTNMKDAWNQGGSNTSSKSWSPQGAGGFGGPSGQSVGASFMSKAGPALLAAFSGCWVAREVFGVGNPKWLLFYHWKETEAPVWFKELYDKHGESFAEWVSDKPRIKSIIRCWMESRINSLETRRNYA